ncbi:MAG: transcriptional regulator with PAS, ATPase and Fis domain [Spirosomataceae bacterium]|jgi:transcriptional regulator with PAS, ATPase and Fis domain
MNNNQEIQTVKNRFGIIGNAPALNYALSVAIQVATTDLSVLISGESGSGKESFSKIIHGLSHRKHGNFIAINCGAIPEGTIDSELFGHTKGSFTGAVDDRKGYFETTDGGTIFLDEIGEMPIGTQSRLLRVLENGEFIPVGSSKVKKTNVRVIAATNVNLLESVSKGIFREDLYYRLNTVPIKVPPLRDRGYDIELLFLKFTTDFSEKNRIEPVDLEESGSRQLLSYRFPGNIRQLKNIAEQITLLEPERTITGSILKKYLPAEFRSTLPALYNQNGGNPLDERDILYKVLFELRSDVTEMKKLVFDLLKGQPKSDIIKEHEDLFTRINDDESRSYLPAYEESKEDTEYDEYDDPAPLERHEILRLDDFMEERKDVRDVQHEMEEESLSLEKKEKEMIIKALRKNNFKRKYAAEDLGISERTLYRKIKQFDIEDDRT